MVFNRRNNRRGRRNTRSSRGRIGRKTRRVYTNGGKVRARTNPSPKQPVIWNPLSIQFYSELADSTVGTLDTTTISSILRSNYRIVSNSDIYVKLHSVKATDLASRSILLTPYDTFSNVTLSNNNLTYDSEPLAYIRDYPGQNSWASCKYVWPLAQRLDPKHLNVTLPVASVVSGITTRDGYIQKRVLIEVVGVWRIASDNVVAEPLSELNAKGVFTDISNDISIARDGTILRLEHKGVDRGIEALTTSLQQTISAITPGGAIADKILSSAVVTPVQPVPEPVTTHAANQRARKLKDQQHIQ